MKITFADMRKGEKMGRTLNEDDVLKEIDRWIGYLDEDMITRIKIGIKKISSAQPDLSEYSDKLWQNAYERGKRDAQPEIIYCKDCKYNDEHWRRVSVKWLPCMDIRTPIFHSKWFCGSAERRENGC